MKLVFSVILMLSVSSVALAQSKDAGRSVSPELQGKNTSEYAVEPGKAEKQVRRKASTEVSSKETAIPSQALIEQRRAQIAREKSKETAVPQ